MPRGYWKASGQFLKSIGKPLGNAHIPAASQYERRQNCPAAVGKNLAISIHFPWTTTFLYLLMKKSKTHWKILKSLSGSSPKYFLSHLTTFSQTQTVATVPLKAAAGSQVHSKSLQNLPAWTFTTLSEHIAQLFEIILRHCRQSGSNYVNISANWTSHSVIN